MKYIISIIILILIFWGCATSNPKEKEQSSNQNHFISFTDLHFTPFADTALVKYLDSCGFDKWDSIFQTSRNESYGSYGNEANYQLLNSALLHMQMNNSSPDFIVVTGDFICHDFGVVYKQITGKDNENMHVFLKKTMQFLVAKIEKTFPNSTIFPTLGNNDAYCGDYQIDMDGEYLKMFANLFYPLIDQEEKNPQIFDDLKSDGFYVASNPINKNHKIISLNSILFTPKYQSTKYERNCDCVLANQDSLVKVQFAWLENQLEICRKKGEQAWLLTHVPPGIDVFSTLEKKKIETYWVEKYIENFMQIIGKYDKLIKITLVGHTHMDDFKIEFNNENPEYYIHITPSLSPIFSNNPAYQIIFYDATKADLINYISCNVDLADSISKWHEEYDFIETYGQTKFTPGGMYDLLQKMNCDSDLLKKYLNYYPSNSKVSTFITSENWSAYKCGMVNFTARNYSNCMSIK